MVLVQYSSYEMVFCGILGRKKMWYLVVFQRQTFGIPKKKVSGNPGCIAVLDFPKSERNFLSLFSGGGGSN